MKTLLLCCTLITLVGCGTRSAEDRVMLDPLRPAVVGYDPGYVTVAERPVPKYRLSGNKIMVSRGVQPIYVLPYTTMPIDEADQYVSIQDDRILTHLDELESVLQRQAGNAKDEDARLDELRQQLLDQVGKDKQKPTSAPAAPAPTAAP